MAKMIQIRNVPDALHRKLKARAARAGMSLSEYLLRDIRELECLPNHGRVDGPCRAEVAGEGQYRSRADHARGKEP